MVRLEHKAMVKLELPTQLVESSILTSIKDPPSFTPLTHAFSNTGILSLTQGHTPHEDCG